MRPRWVEALPKAVKEARRIVEVKALEKLATKPGIWAVLQTYPRGFWAAYQMAFRLRRRHHGEGFEFAADC